MGMAYTVPASVVVMVFAIWLRMNLKESPVFEKVNDSNQPTQNLHLLVACSRANPSGWQQGCVLVRLVTQVNSDFPCRLFSADVIV